MLEKIWAYSKWFASQLWQQFVERDCLSNAASLTYTTLFAVVPLMTVAYATLSAISDFSSIGETIQSFIFSNFVPQSSAIIQDQLTKFSAQARQLTGFSGVFLVVTAFLMLVTIEKAFNLIWHVTEPRKGLQRFLLYWGVMTFGLPLLAAGVSISSYLFSLPLITGLDTFGLKETLLSYTPVLFTIAAFTLLYYAVPNTRVPFRHALLGGFLTMLMFELAKQLFGLIVAKSNLAIIYGAFAAVPLFLSWLYLVWALVLIGAIVVRTLSLKPEADEAQQQPALIQCLLILRNLHTAHMQGSSLTEPELLENLVISDKRKDRIFSVLQSLKVLGMTEDERLALSRSLRSISLWMLYQKLPEGLEPDTLARVDDLPQIIDRLKAFVSFGVDRLSVSLEELFNVTAEVSK